MLDAIVSAEQSLLGEERLGFPEHSAKPLEANASTGSACKSWKACCALQCPHLLASLICIP